ncbi:MAG: SH3 domain-containing protein [Christensenellaceae bacterium]|nr:SH3 domain-containing protein [Christensenellaceae bacterium]MEA5069761.1 SH3 domain-containing protein [Christensenellaceae bacterium]
MKIKKTVSVLLAALFVATCVSASALTLGVVRMPSKDGTVWLRSGGGTSYPQIGYARHGDILGVNRQGNYWYNVTLRQGPSSGKTGWMYKKYITLLKDPTDMGGWGALARIKTKYAGSTVNLRKGPGTSYAVKDTMTCNEMLIILDKYNSKWYEVQVVSSLRTGYVYKEYITNGALGRTTANVNLRKSASTSARILLTIPSGDAITVLSIGKNWSKVRYDGKTGYIWNGYFRFS